MVVLLRPSSDPSSLLRSRTKKKPIWKKWIPLILQSVWFSGVIALMLGFFVLNSSVRNLDNSDKRFPDISSQTYEDHHCPAYGCPVYPLEKDSNEVQEALRILGTRRALHVPPFARSMGTTVTFQSNEHQFNQDRAFIIRPFHTHQTAHLGKDESFLIAILDGHGVEGHIVSEYVSKELPRLLASKLDDRPAGQMVGGATSDEEDEWIKQQLIDTFVEVDQGAPPNALRGGCTASVTLRIGPKLYFANAGDSRTLLVSVSSPVSSIKDQKQQQQPGKINGQDNHVEIVYHTRPDKPHLPDEKARIEGLGGQIHIPPQNPSWSRVIVYSESALPAEHIGLAMSRSIGDWEWKEVGVTAEPIVDVVDLRTLRPVDSEHGNNNNNNAQSLFVLAASDGLWDLRKEEVLAEKFAAGVVKSREAKSNLLQSSVEIIELVSPQNKDWYRDDITVIVIPTTL